MAATNSYIQVAADGDGKLMQTYLASIGGLNVHAEAVRLVDGDLAALGTTGDSLNVYLPSINAAITGSVTVASSNASNFLTTVTGTVTATAGTNLNTALLSTAAKQTDGSQKSQICDPINVSNIAGITSGALNVYLPTITANSGTNLNTGNVAIKVFQGAATLASGQVTMTNVSTTIAAARPTRRSATIRNQDSTNSGYIGPAPIGTANGLLLGPLDSVAVDFVGVIAGISATTSNVTFGYLETYD